MTLEERFKKAQEAFTTWRDFEKSPDHPTMRAYYQERMVLRNVLEQLLQVPPKVRASRAKKKEIQTDQS